MILIIQKKINISELILINLNITEEDNLIESVESENKEEENILI